MTALDSQVERGEIVPRRALGLFDGIAIVVGSVIGSAIFVVPSTIAGLLNSPFAVLSIWTMGGILAMFGALSLAELSAMFPGAGGLYVYLRETYGPLVAFVYGWGLLAMIHSGSIAALSVAFGLYSAQLFPLGALSRKVVAIGCILLLTGVNCLGIRYGKLVQNIFALAKVGGATGMIIILLAYGSRPVFSSSVPATSNHSGFEIVSFGIALVAVLWAYEGWHVVSFAAGEMKNPRRDLPRCLCYGTLIVIAIYLLANVSYYRVLLPEEIRNSPAVAGTAITLCLGRRAGGFISTVILISVWGALNGMVLTGPRVYYAMARDGNFFPAFSRINKSYRTPVFALLVQGVWASILTWSGSYQEIFTNVIFTAWIFYGLAVASVIVLRWQRPDFPRPFRVPGFPWIPLLFCLAALGLAVSTVVAGPKRASLGIGLILTGVPVYLFVRRGKTKAVQSIGAQDATE